MRLLRSHPEHLDNFNEWVDKRILTLGVSSLEASDWDTVLGLKFFAGELEALRTVINNPIVEAQTLAEMETQDGRTNE